jgi:hypothetical protein
MSSPGADDWKAVFVGQDMSDPFIKAAFSALSKAAPDRRRQLLDSLSRIDGIAERHRHWAMQLVQISKAIDDAGAQNPWPLRELFWIRLFGALFEIPAHLEKIAASPGTSKGHPVLLAARKALDAIERMREALSESERVVLHWLRDRAAHVRPELYELRWEGGKLKERRTIKGVATVQTVGEIDRHRDAVLTAFGSDAAFAAALVTRLKNDLLILYTSAHEMDAGANVTGSLPSRRRARSKSKG